jgi:hypothetical protein
MGRNGPFARWVSTATEPSRRSDRTRRDAVETTAALNGHNGTGRYMARQRRITRGIDAPTEQPRPLEFDASGFPIPQPIPTFVQRVRRLLGDERAR